VINSFGGEQDNVVFLGRRSFRMELAGRPGGNELGIPRSASEIPTERIFDSDRERAVSAAMSSSRPAKGISNTGSIALALTTFTLGIALTLTFHRADPRRPLATAPIEIAPPTPPATPVLVQLPAPAAEPIEIPPARAVPPARRPLAKPAARATRPRPVRAAVPSDPPAPKPWVDPFAE
jgi:hypothetical protein